MGQKITLYFTQLRKRPVLQLALAAAILYCSWPLGYILNPFVGTHDLASQLEAPHQPYNWLFIMMDVLAGLAVTLIAIMQINKHSHSLVKWCIISYGIFGVLVALSALTPLNCNITADTCGPILRNPSLLIHGGASILSVGFLFLSTLAIGAAAFREHTRPAKLIFALMISAWLFFGFGSLVELMFHDKGNGMQEYFITICSISILLIISFIEHRQTVKIATAEQTID
ncbi:MAG TPA: DUF998 domain-containing protein [Candidatus Saccharimonadales bacterium]|nr:DUF998 domain-containing protein [Candidatus Saccharimonadales bacterium]